MNLSANAATLSGSVKTTVPLACCLPIIYLTPFISTLFQANGIALKHGKKFHHDFNVKHIASVEAKQLKVSREIETLKEKKKTFERTFKGLQGNYVSGKSKLK